MDPAPSLIHSRRSHSPVPFIGLFLRGSGISSVLVQGGSRHHCWVDPCLTMGNQLLHRVEDKMMALLGPSSPFVSSHCAPMFYFPFILLLSLVTTGQKCTTRRGHSCRAKALRICPTLERGGKGQRTGQHGRSRMESPSVLGARWQGHSLAQAAHGANTEHVAAEFSNRAPQINKPEVCWVNWP